MFWGLRYVKILVPCYALRACGAPPVTDFGHQQQTTQHATKLGDGSKAKRALRVL
jgi:hypothetical protein